MKIDHLNKQSGGSLIRRFEEHQDEHIDLYWFGLSESNTLTSVWVSVCFIDLGELDRRARNEGITNLGVVMVGRQYTRKRHAN
jgi:hypothetical protein